MTSLEQSSMILFLARQYHQTVAARKRCERKYGLHSASASYHEGMQDALKLALSAMTDGLQVVQIYFPGSAAA